MATVLAIPDLHTPFHNSSALLKVYSLATKIKPDVIVCLGDQFDMLSFSKFPRSHNIMTPKDELTKARDILEEMWAKLKVVVPKAKRFSLTGNHTERPLKRILEKAPEFESFLSFDRLIEFKDVETIPPRDELEIDGVLYIHGFLSGIGKHLNYFQKSVVFGHLHSAHIFYQPRKKEMQFEMCCGYLANPNALALSYTPTKFTRWATGVGLIDKLGPRFVCL